MSNVELATAYITLVPSMKGSEAQITQDLGNVGAAAGATASRGFLGTIGGAVGGIVGVAAKGTALIGGLIGGMAVKGGISRQLQIEDATAKLAGLGHSTTEVKAIMGNALASVKGTAFGLGEAGTVAAGAVAAGIKPGADLQRILGLTADTATITGASMSDMGAIFNKVAANGKLTLGDVNQLQDRGFPILQMVAKQYGVTASAASKMVTDGKVDFSHFADAIQAGVGGAALKSGDTTRGAFANMGAAISRFGVVLTGGFYPLAKVFFNQVTAIFDGLNTKLKPFATEWGATFQSKALPILKNFSTNVLTEFDKIFAVFELFRSGGGISAKMAKEFGPATIIRITTFGDDVRTALDSIKRTFALFGTGLKVPPNIAKNLNPAEVPAMMAFGIGVAGAAAHFHEAAGKFIGGMFALSAAFKAGDGDITSSGFAGTMEKIGNFARSAVDKAEPVFHRIKVAWNTMMIGLSSGNFSGVGGSVLQIFGALTTIADPMKNVLLAVGSNIGSVATQFGNLLAGALPLIAPLIQAAADALKLLADHSDLLMPILVAMGAAWLVYQTGVTLANFAELGALPIKAASIASQLALANANITLAAAIATANGEEVAGRVARLPAIAQVIIHTGATIAHGVAVGATAVAMGVATAAQWLWNAAMDANPIMIVVLAVAALVGGIIWAYNSIGWFKDGVNAAWAFISSVTMTVLGAVGSFFVGLWHGIVAVAVAVVSGLVSFFSGAWNNIGNFTRTVFGAIGAFFGAVWRTAVAVVTAIVVGYVSMVLGAWNNVSNFTRSVFSGVASFLGGVWNGIVNGVSSMIGNVLNFFGGLGGKIMGALSGAASWLFNIGKDVINGLINGIQSMIGAIGNAILSLVPGPIVQVFKDALGIRSPSRVFHGFGQNIGQGLVNGVVSHVGYVRNAMGQLVKATHPAQHPVYRAFGGYIGWQVVAGLEGSASSIRSTVDKLTKGVRAAFDHKAITKGTENSLVGLLAAENGQLVGLANQRDSITARLKSASSALATALAGESKYAGGISGAVLGGVDASKSNDFLGDLQVQIDKTREFTKTLAALKALGLNSATYKQLADAGLGALGSAEGLLDTGRAGIQKIDVLQKTLSQAATNLGNVAAAGLYGAGVNSAQGLVNGLKSQQGQISQHMGNIANSMTGTIKKKLGINSPSTVFYGFGGDTMDGYILGTQSKAKDVAQAMKDIVQLPTAADISAGANMLVPQMLATRQTPAALAPGAAGGSITQNIYPQPGQSEELIGEYSMRQLTKAGFR